MQPQNDPVAPAGPFRYKAPVSVAKAPPRKKFDWVLAFLYILLTAGIALIGAITYFVLLM